jgi:hypothetical protein
MNAADKNIKMNKGFLLGIFACGVGVVNGLLGVTAVVFGVPLACLELRLVFDNFWNFDLFLTVLSMRRPTAERNDNKRSQASWQ